MKGIIIAGGLGTRLYPLTHVTSKHLLPVWNKPSIYYPIETMRRVGITDIMLTIGGPHAGDFLHVLGDGKKLGLDHLEYTFQEQEGGIAQALGLCEFFAGGEPVAVLLGDNIFEDWRQIKKGVELFQKQGKGGKIFLKKVPDPERFGVAELQGEAIVGIEEKPKAPKSDLCVTGVYLYDGRVFDVIKKLKPSGRGELEITDVNNFYVNEGTMTYEIVQGEWIDTGTFDALLRATLLAKRLEEQTTI